MTQRAAGPARPPQRLRARAALTRANRARAARARAARTRANRARAARTRANRARAARTRANRALAGPTPADLAPTGSATVHSRHHRPAAGADRPSTIDAATTVTDWYALTPQAPQAVAPTSR